MISDKILKFGSHIFKKFLYVNYFLLILLILIFSIGLLLLYSASGGSMEPWASKQLSRFILSILLFFFVAFMNVKFLLGASYYIYFISLLLLISVNFIGNSGM